MRSKLLLSIILVLIILPLASSFDGVVKQGEAVDLRVTVTINASINDVESNITVTDPDGIILIPFQVMTKNILSQDFNYTVPASNNSKIGTYQYTIYSFSDIAIDEAFGFTYEVSPSGKAYIPEISGPLLFAAVLTLVFISLFLLLLGNRIENFQIKVFLIILSGIFAILAIGFVAGSFQEFFSTDSGLSNSLGGFYKGFIILLSGASIVLLLWGFLAAVKVYKVKRGFFINED